MDKDIWENIVFFFKKISHYSQYWRLLNHVTRVKLCPKLHYDDDAQLRCAIMPNFATTTNINFATTTSVNFEAKLGIAVVAKLIFVVVAKLILVFVAKLIIVVVAKVGINVVAKLGIVFIAKFGAELGLS